MKNEDAQLNKREAAIVKQLRDHLNLGRTLQEAKLTLLDLCEEVEIDRAIKFLKDADSRFRNAKEVATLHDEPNYTGWYLGPEREGSSTWSGLVRTLKSKSWSETMIENLDIASNGVVEQLAPPRSEKQIQVKGLVLGYVQSGKTANYSAVIAKAVDAGYRLIIVLAGMHNNLRRQTQERLKLELVDPNPSRCTTLTSVDEQGDFQKRQNVGANRALSVDGYTLVVLKKNTSVLRNFHSWLSSASKEIIKKTPTLIIDDESDQASINTAKPEDDPTAINSHIRSLMTTFHVSSYIGYTATPFANVLVDSNEESDVFPRDFLISLGKPPNYFGAEELFGRERVGALNARDGLRVVRAIPPEDEMVFTQKQLKELAENDPDLCFLTPSMRDAVDSFILGCALRITRGQHKKHMTMLLHVSHLNAVQSKLKAEVDAYVKSLKISAEVDSGSLSDRMKRLWSEDFEIVSKDFEGTTATDFDRVFKYCKRVIEEIDTVLENSKSLDRLSFEAKDPLRIIVIGGNVLSRGLTLEGLTVSYFVRTTKAYDTLLQMGRWFGYRPGYIDLTRIFVTEDLRDHFYHLATVEQEVRDEIKAMAANSERPIDVGLRIRNHPHMTVTASNKMRRAEDCAYTYSGTKIQARHLITQNREALDQNYRSIKDLYARCEKFGKRESSILQDFRKALLFREVSQEVILQFLDQYLFSPENGKFTNELIREYISKQNQVNELKDWSVAILSSQQGIEVELGGETVRALDRSVLRKAYREPGADSVQLRALSTPGDELVDLGDTFESRVEKVEHLLPEGKERESEIALRRRYRPTERGLLLIYPLNWKQTHQGEKKFSMSQPLEARGPVFGITFVFPFSHKDQSRFGFITNRTIKEPKITPVDIELETSSATPEVTSQLQVSTAAITSTMESWRLSKSQYVKGRKCLKRVWLYNHQRDLADDPSELQTLLFAQGNEVGKLAQRYFENGYLIHEDYRDPEGALKHTNDAIKNKDLKVLFEAAFLYENVLIRADIIRKNEDGSIDLIEVKSTNSIKKEHKDDVAVQKYLLEGLGYRVGASYLMHLNGNYVLDGELNLKELFTLVPLDEEIEEQLSEVPNYLKLIRSTLTEKSMPDSPIGSVCKNPYPCEFKGYCWKEVTKDSIHQLVRITDKKRAELTDMGAKTLVDVPSDYELTESQRIQVEVFKSGLPHIEKDKIKAYLGELKWPLHFLDYETIQFAIPQYQKTSPYQQLPFQFSMHIQRSPDGPVEHHEFLHRTNSDPRQDFTETLLSKIDGDAGSIIVYHAGFERNITKALKDFIPDFSDALDELNARMWDLEVPFAKRWYCDPGIGGSSSIKRVLPALVPSLSYDDLEIQKGDVAQKKYGEMIRMRQADGSEQIAKALLEYCKLDTLAMVEILKELRKLTES